MLLISGQQDALPHASPPGVSRGGILPSLGEPSRESGVTVPVYYAVQGRSRHHLSHPCRWLAPSLGSAEDFIVLNMNTNIVRKRWDVCLGAGRSSSQLLCERRHLFLSSAPYRRLGPSASLLWSSKGWWSPLHEAHCPSILRVIPCRLPMHPQRGCWGLCRRREGFGLCAVGTALWERPSAIGGGGNIDQPATGSVTAQCRQLPVHVDGSRMNGGCGRDRRLAAEALMSLKPIVRALFARHASQRSTSHRAGKSPSAICDLRDPRGATRSAPSRSQTPCPFSTPCQAELEKFAHAPARGHHKIRVGEACPVYSPTGTVIMLILMCGSPWCLQILSSLSCYM
jgi:hypothetical protein